VKALVPSFAALFLIGCVSSGGAPAPSPAATARGMVRAGTPAEVDIARARAQSGERAFTWAAWSPETFERARREGKLLLLDGAAEWCHWCHVMDETTYRDPAVGALLRDRFIAVRVDIDEHPDLAERYGDWGWPATILFSPDAREIGKFRGYIAPRDLETILRDAEALAKEKPGEAEAHGAADVPAPVEALGFAAGEAALQLDAYYDEKEGGWGQRQKSPLGASIEFELRRAAHGDAAARQRALFSLSKQRALIDPVWGGVYQYSAAATWDKPHYEKLMTYQAANLEAYARGYEAEKDPSLLADAQKIAGYLSTFLSNADGAFLVSQDADAGAHDQGALFVDGDVYYRLADAERRKLGVPRVDDHVYAQENGLAIRAFATLFEVDKDPAALARGRRAADLVLRTLVAPDGAVRRGGSQARFLADAAAFGHALARLGEVSGEATYREAAVKIAAAMDRDLADTATGAYWSNTPDPAAAGVFARRDRSFPHNVVAARFLAALARVTGEAAYRDRARRALAAVLTPRALTDRGRMVGEVLLALDECGAYPWDAARAK
jgi:uncharacterized protein